MPEIFEGVLMFVAGIAGLNIYFRQGESLYLCLGCLFAFAGLTGIGVIIERRKKESPRAVIRSGSPLGYEYYVAGYLRRHGYRRVEVTQASRDYGADVLARDRLGRRVCVQCKLYRGSVGVKAVQEIVASKAYYGCNAAMVFTTGTYTQQARVLAKSNGVALKKLAYRKAKRKWH